MQPYFRTPVLPSQSEEIRFLLTRGSPPNHPSPLPPSSSIEPWLRHTPSQRLIREQNFVFQSTLIIQNSVEKTEMYIWNKDRLMLEYLSVFPVVEWIVGVEEGMKAFESFWAREGMRRQDKSVFEKEVQGSWWFEGRVVEVKKAGDVGSQVAQQGDSDVLGMETVVTVFQIAPEEGVMDGEINEDGRVESTLDSVVTIFDFAPSDGELPETAITETDHANQDTKDETYEERRKQAVRGKRKATPPETITPEPQQHSPRTSYQQFSSPKKEATKETRKKKKVEKREPRTAEPPRRSTRVAGKRKFSDMPWS